LKLIRTLAMITAGYLVAVAVATVVALMISLTPTALPDQGAMGSIYGWWVDAGMALAFSSGLTFVFALPGFIVAVALAERFSWTNWPKYSLAGALNAIVAHMLMAMYSSGSLTHFYPFGTLKLMIPLILASIVGGFAGGAAYWYAAGRYVARRRAPIASAEESPN